MTRHKACAAADSASFRSGAWLVSQGNEDASQAAVLEAVAATRQAVAVEAKQLFAAIETASDPNNYHPA